MHGEKISMRLAGRVDFLDFGFAERCFIYCNQEISTGQSLIKYFVFFKNMVRSGEQKEEDKWEVTLKTIYHWASSSFFEILLDFGTQSPTGQKTKKREVANIFQDELYIFNDHAELICTYCYISMLSLSCSTHFNSTRNWIKKCIKAKIKHLINYTLKCLTSP